MYKEQQMVNSNAQGSKLLKELLESSRNLPTSSSELGTIELGSSELKKRIEGLRTTKNVSEANFTKAHYLLAGSGLSIEDLERDIKSIELPSTLDSSIVPAHGNNVDFDSQLNSKKEENILAAIEQSLTTAARDFDNFINQNITMDWRKRKDEIYQSFGFETKHLKTNSGVKASKPSVNGTWLSADDSDKNASKMSNWGKSTVGHSVLGPRLGGGEFADLPKDAKLTNVNDFAVRAKFEKYSMIIYRLNNLRQQLKPFPIATCFYETTKDATDSKTKQINECWKILAGLVEESETNILPEQHFFQQYDNLKAKSSSGLKNRIIKKSIRYLEQQFLEHVNTIYHRRIDENDAESGLPTNLNKVKYYVKTQKNRLFGNEDISKNLLIVNDVPIWALIYYLLRSGCYDEACAAVEKEAVTFKHIDSNFATYLKGFIESSKDENNGNHSLSASLQNSIHQEFNTNIKNNDEVDVYRYAVYKIIGKCDLTKKWSGKLSSSTEGWIWTNLMLINENNKEYSGLLKYESYTLLDFQKNLIQYGSLFFNWNTSNPIYIHVLMLSGLFEQAVKHAFSVSELEAVNLAIGLTYYGLLRVGDYDSILANISTSNNLTTVNKDGLYEINYARLVGYYTRSFRVLDTKVALEYLLAINLAGGVTSSKRDKYCKLTLEAIRELVIETKEFSLLLGTINKDGSRYPGRIEERQQLLYIGNTKSDATGKQQETFTGNNTYLFEIIEQAAKRVGEEGRVYDSLLLYQLSENHHQVINIINRLLGDLLSSIDIFQPVSKDNEQEYSLIEIGQRLLDTYNLNPSKISPASKEILKKLLMIAKIKELFIEGKYENNLESIKELDMIPISSGDNLAAVRAKCQVFNQQQLHYSLIKNVGNLLLITMNCISRLITKYGSSAFLDNVKEEKISELKSVSKQIMVFAGMIQYKMAKEVYIKLTTLELDHN